MELVSSIFTFFTYLNIFYKLEGSLGLLWSLKIIRWPLDQHWGTNMSKSGLASTILYWHAVKKTWQENDDVIFFTTLHKKDYRAVLNLCRYFKSLSLTNSLICIYTSFLLRMLSALPLSS